MLILPRVREETTPPLNYRKKFYEKTCVLTYTIKYIKIRKGKTPSL
jgi:hypothetical protein